MTISRPVIVPSLFYNDPQSALDFLEEAFGLELAMSVTDDEGHILHAEMAFNNARIMVGGANWAPWPHSPQSLEGANTQGLHMAVENVDEHCARARSAGAQIIAEPEDQFYGDRTYRALDCEGHFWTFSHKVREVSIEAMEAASGFQIKDTSV